MMADKNGNARARLRYHYSEKDYCLNCELPKCVHDYGGPPDEECPLLQLKRKPGPQVPAGHMPFNRARRMLGISEARLKRMIKSGQCPAQVCGHSQRATIAIPIEWIEAHQKP